MDRLKTGFRWPWIIPGVVIGALGIGSWRWIAEHRIVAWRLPDGTEVFCQASAAVEPVPGFPHPRELRVNGDLFIRASESADSVMVRSRLLSLTLAGGTEVRVTAYSNQTGEEAEVLRGRVVARKAYPSPDRDPDTLDGGQMVMVNQTIDLMEKESGDPDALKRWTDGLVGKAGRPIDLQGPKP